MVNRILYLTWISSTLSTIRHVLFSQKGDLKIDSFNHERLVVHKTSFNLLQCSISCFQGIVWWARLGSWVWVSSGFKTSSSNMYQLQKFTVFSNLSLNLYRIFWVLAWIIRVFQIFFFFLSLSLLIIQIPNYWDQV